MLHLCNLLVEDMMSGRQCYSASASISGSRERGATAASKP